MAKTKNSEINPQKIAAADIVVGIPSLNEGDNIAFVAAQIDAGLREFFPKYKSVIVNVDNCSKDNTRAAFLNCPTETPKIYLSTPEGVRGKGNNFRNLFEKARELKALAVAVFDADLRSIEPSWVREMLTPIVEKNLDFCTPKYARSEYDGSITNHICFPLIRGLLGVNLRQPIGGDFALSSRLVEKCLRRKWSESTRQYGVDIFLTMTAILGEFEIGEVGLGAKIHKPSAPKLGPMFTQVVTTLFNFLRKNRRKWSGKIAPRQLEQFGAPKLAAPQTVAIDYKKMKSDALAGFAKSESTLREILRARNFAELARMFASGKIRIGAQIWCESVFDALAAFEKNPRPEIIESLKPLYFGRFIYFFRETLEKNSAESEKEIETQARLFWRHRDYFLRKTRIKSPTRRPALPARVA